MLAKPQWPTDAFEQWWSAYPKKVAKKFAQKCFERLRKSGEIPFEVLLSTTKCFASSVIGKDMKFVPFPASWLNAGRFDDDPDALLDVKVQPQAMPLRSGMFIIKRGSPQALAWAKHRGRDFPWGREGVWTVDAEWPPEGVK